MKYIGYLYVLLMLVSCATTSEQTTISDIKRNPNMEVIDIDKAENVKRINFSSVVGKPKVIVLETKPECMIKEIRAVEVFKDNVYILDDETNRLYVFDMNGKYLRSVGEPGRAHGEYLQISDFSIDAKSNVVYVWDEALDKALKYDVATGKYLSSITTERNGERTFCMLHYNKKLYLNRTAVSNDLKYHIKEVDENTGAQTASYLESEKYNKGWNFPLRLESGFFYCKNHKEPKYVEMFSDTIVKFTPRGVMPAYVVKSKGFITQKDIEYIARNSTFKSRRYDFSKLDKSSTIYQVSCLAEFGNYLLFKYLRGCDRQYLLYDKKIHKASVAPLFSDDYICDKNNIPTDILFTDKKYALTAIKPVFMKYLYDNVISQGRLKKEIDNYDALSGIKEDSNPVLLLHKIK